MPYQIPASLDGLSVTGRSPGPGSAVLRPPAVFPFHQGLGVGRWPVAAVKIAPQHSQRRHLLTSVMRGVRDASDYDPRLRAGHV